MILPDKTVTLARSDAEAAFGYMDMGPGVYHLPNGDTWLVEPVDRAPEDMWDSAGPDDEKFHFHLYVRRDVTDVIALLAGVRQRTYARPAKVTP